MPAFLLYIDPGSSSLLLQGIIGVCLSVLVFFKTIKYKVLSLFGRHKPTQDVPSQESQVNTDSKASS